VDRPDVTDAAGDELAILKDGDGSPSASTNPSKTTNYEYVARSAIPQYFVVARPHE